MPSASLSSSRRCGSSTKTLCTAVPSPICHREGEQELIAWMTFDADDGVDYGYLPYARRPSGDPVFDNHTMFTAPLQPYDDFPGRHLLSTLTQDPGEQAGT